MNKQELIELLQSTKGDEIGITYDREGVAVELEVQFCLATKRSKRGVRWLTDKARSGLLVIRPKSRT